MLILYSLPSCPKCEHVKTELNRHGVMFTVSEDTSVMREKGIDAVPVLENTVTGIIHSMPEIISFLNGGQIL